jgi:hypothetical protein
MIDDNMLEIIRDLNSNIHKSAEKKTPFRFNYDNVNITSRGKFYWQQHHSGNEKEYMLG